MKTLIVHLYCGNIVASFSFVLQFSYKRLPTRDVDKRKNVDNLYASDLNSFVANFPQFNTSGSLNFPKNFTLFNNTVSSFNFANGFRSQYPNGTNIPYFNPMYNYGSLTASSDLFALKKDVGQLRSRLDKVEKSLISGQYMKLKTPVGSFIDSLTATTISIDAVTVSNCAIITFFVIGAIIGASLLDRFWLLGGLLSAWWASGAVTSESREGYFARNVGLKFALLIKEIQEKYNQFIVFYRTGQLAYTSQKLFEKYDKMFAITNKWEDLKFFATRQASDFNTFFQTTHFTDQLKTGWKSLQNIPSEVWKLDKEYQVTSNLVNYGSNILYTTSDVIVDLAQSIRDNSGGVTYSNSKPNRINNKSNYRYTPKYSSNNNNNRKRSNLFSGWNWGGRNSLSKKPVNPWSSPFTTLPMIWSTRAQSKQRERERSGGGGLWFFGNTNRGKESRTRLNAYRNNYSLTSSPNDQSSSSSRNHPSLQWKDFKQLVMTAVRRQLRKYANTIVYIYRGFQWFTSGFFHRIISTSKSI